MKYLRRPLPSPQGWTDNTPIVFRIPREHYLKRLKIHVELVLNQTSTGTALQDAPWSAVQRIDVIANGKDTIRSITGFQLFEYNRWYYGVDATKVGGYALAVASGNNRVAFDVYLDFPPATSELLGVLPTFRLSSLDLVILTGNGGTISSAGTPVITAASSGFQVETDEIVRDAESDAYLGPLTEFITFQSQLVRNPSGTGDYDIDLPVGADYLDLLVIHRNGASVAAITNQGRADTVTREVKLLGDYVKVIADEIAQVNTGGGYQIAGGYDTEWYFDGGMQATLRDAGVSMVDFMKGGADGSKRLTELDGRKWRSLPVRSAEFATMTLRSTIQTFTTNAAVEVVPFRIFRLR